MNHLQPLWKYRSFIFGTVKREFQIKYRDSLLGAAWTMLQPLSMIFIYTVIFSQIMKARLPGVESTFGYSIYLCAGILTWSFFTEIVTRAQDMFLANANLIKKLTVPRLSFPIAIVFTAFLNFSIVFGLFTLFLIATDTFPGLVFVTLLPLLALLALFAVSLGMVLGILNVFFRDVGHCFGILINFWFWLTPIVYPASILGDKIRPLIGINPLFNYMEAIHGVLVQGLWPSWSSLQYLILLTALLCWMASLLFRRHSSDLVDEL